MVRRGMRWRVGNGESIKVWSDPWIPRTQTRKIISPRGEANEAIEVGALINPITKMWNEELLSTLFLPFEVERILNIPISHRMPEDCLCWDLEKNGMYSVRSAYRALASDVWRSMEEAPSSVMDVWKVIWSATVLPRVKLFAWRACLDALPTKVGLYRRVPAISALCGVCGWRKIQHFIL